jgi:hypothetical protein
MIRRSLCTAALIAALAATVHAEPTRDYVVKDGDTCIKIATDELGDRQLYLRIHALNPQLGPLPHILRAGQILKLPRIGGDTGPDARLTSARGAVKVRRPTDAIWDAAQRGMELFRAWRVNARTRSSAEITFRDASRLYMREDTIVVIYGPAAARTPTVAVEATLDSGALESRLAAATGGGAAPTLRIHTPSALADLAVGEALVSVDQGASIVANHGGQPARVRAVDAQQRPRGAAVAVAAGMGSKVRPGQLPDKPRPLPPAPTWPTGAPDRYVSIAGAGATVATRWTPVATAARYRLAIVGDGDVDITAAIAPATATGLELHGLPAGHYRARVATIDADGFEGVRSPDFAFEVIEVAVIPPGATAPAAAAPPAIIADAEAGADLTAAVAPPALAVGTRVVAPDGIACDPIADAAATALTCHDGTGAALGAAPIRAVALVVAATGTTAAPVIARGRITTVALAVSSEVPIGADFQAAASDGLTVVAIRPIPGGVAVDLEAAATAGTSGALHLRTAGTPAVEVATVALAIEARVAASPPPPPPAPIAARGPMIEVGGFAGVRTFARNNHLGAPTDPAHELAAGPFAGARFGYWPGAVLGGEVELAAVAGRYEGIDGAVGLASLRAHLVLRRQGRHLGARLVAGIGADTLLTTSTGTATDNALVYDLGVAGTCTTDSGLTLRVDLRDDLDTTATGAHAHGLDASLGLSVPFR